MTIIERRQSEPVAPARAPAASAAAGAARRYRPLLGALLLVTAVKQLVLALLYPPFQGHDEVAHLAYLWVLVTQHRIPTFSDAIPNALSSYSRFTLDWPALYTANHPPLFYVLSWPAWELSGDTWGAKLYAVRLVSIPLFLATVWLSYRLALALAPATPSCSSASRR
jgi:hypothetical protein